MVHVPPPPASRVRPQIITWRAGTILVRLFDPSRFNTTALTFRRFGPLLRFDHHRAPLDSRGIPQPCLDSERGVYYAAKTLSGCIVEIFGDSGFITPGDWHVARPTLKRDIRLLNLRGAGAMRSGSVAALAKVPDHTLSQKWSRYFYEQPEFKKVDGLLYFNAHNDEDAVVLYERAEDAINCPNSQVMRLDDPLLRAGLLKIARQNNLICSP